MVGSDIVDLADPETRPGAAHPRFDARVFDEDERRARMPWLRPRGAWIRGDLSFPHHGRFAAYACVLR